MTLFTFTKTLLIILSMHGVFTRNLGRSDNHLGVSLTCADPFTSRYPYQELICEVPGGGEESSIYWQLKYFNSSLNAGFYCGTEGCDTMDDAYFTLTLFQRVDKLLTSTLTVRSGPMDGEIESISCWGKSEVDNRWFKSKECPTVYGPTSVSTKTQTVIVDKHVSTSDNDLIHDRAGGVYAGCFYKGIKHPHDSIFNMASANPCWQTRCYRGNMWDVADGCYVDGACYSVNKKFTLNCKTMICRKHRTGKDKFKYSHITSRTRCEAANGDCHPVGSTGFSAIVDGEEHERNCECMWGGWTKCTAEYNPYGQGK